MAEEAARAGEEDPLPVVEPGTHGGAAAEVTGEGFVPADTGRRPRETGSDEQGKGAPAVADAPTVEVRIDQGAIDDLVASIDKLTSAVRSDQDVISRMQQRIETLQGEQVRALLGPSVVELANLQAAFIESAGRDYERLGLERVRKEFALLADRLDAAIDLLGAESIGAQPGDPFDSRLHQALKQVPIADPERDRTIADVVRQGFTFDPNGKPALYARVRVYAYDSSLAPADQAGAIAVLEREAPGEAPPQATPPPLVGGVPCINDDHTHEHLAVRDGDLELPFPLDPQ